MSKIICPCCKSEMEILLVSREIPDTTVPLSYILAVVADYYGLSVDEMKGKKRYKNIMEARQIYVYLARVYNKAFYSVIARTINRDHTTIINQYDRMLDYIETNDPMCSKLFFLRDKLFPSKLKVA